MCTEDYPHKVLNIVAMLLCYVLALLLDKSYTSFPSKPEQYIINHLFKYNIYQQYISNIQYITSPSLGTKEIKTRHTLCACARYLCASAYVLQQFHRNSALGARAFHLLSKISLFSHLFAHTMLWNQNNLK